METALKMENDFDYKLIPAGFIHCFNARCPEAGGCLRHVAARYSAEAGRYIRVVNPACFPAGDTPCPDFKSAQEVRVAWGITNLLEKVPYQTARHLRKVMIFHFTKTLYYRYYRKEYGISPEAQLYIRNFFGSMGSRRNLCSILIRKSMTGEKHSPLYKRLSEFQTVSNLGTKSFI